MFVRNGLVQAGEGGQAVSKTHSHSHSGQFETDYCSDEQMKRKDRTACRCFLRLGRPALSLFCRGLSSFLFFDFTRVFDSFEPSAFKPCLPPYFLISHNLLCLIGRAKAIREIGFKVSFEYCIFIMRIFFGKNVSNKRRLTYTAILEFNYLVCDWPIVTHCSDGRLIICQRFF